MTESVDIYCDGNAKIGLGHVRRSFALAKELQRLGVVTRIISLSIEANRLLNPLSELESTEADPAEVALFDAPHGLDEPLLKAHRIGQKTVALDWFGETSPDVAIAVYPHAAVRARADCYVGFQYVIIRQEIQKESALAPGRGAVVVLGGADVLEQGPRAAACVAKKGLEVTLVQGPLTSGETVASGFRVVHNPSNLPQLLSGCRLAVTNAGTCMFESLFLRRATVALPQSRREHALAEAMVKRGALVGVGLNQLDKVPFGGCDEVADGGRRVIDGQGVSRVAKIVAALT